MVTELHSLYASTDGLPRRGSKEETHSRAQLLKRRPRIRRFEPLGGWCVTACRHEPARRYANPKRPPTTTSFGVRCAMQDPRRSKYAHRRRRRAGAAGTGPRLVSERWPLFDVTPRHIQDWRARRGRPFRPGRKTGSRSLINAPTEQMDH
ncbi:hypothetical protein MRX96_003426 [Rhipicephalus microplus]